MSASSPRLLSPSRLSDFLGCEYRTWLDLQHEKGVLDVAQDRRGDADLLAELGRQHEQAFLDEQRAAGRDVVEIPDDDVSFSDRARLTREAMAEGREIIHQACFLHDGWVGFADFLVRVETPSAEWPWSYEVHDAKLGRSPRPNYIFQLLFYTDQVERLQGTRPERMHLILGDGERPPFAPEDFEAYAQQVVGHFTERRAELAAGEHPAYPYRVGDCDFCPYWQHCEAKRRDDDHVSLTATVFRDQGLKLEAAGVTTVAALAALAPDAAVPAIPPDTLNGMREQADLQIRSRGLDVPLYMLREPEAERGLHRLPEPAFGDVFFDFEGDPYFDGEGLEYLFGSIYRDEDGEWTYWSLWAHDRAGERAAFEQWMDWITERLERFPDLHVFHYHSYEATALKTLMSRYATREHEVDELLRRHVLVDLYPILRQAARVGTERHGLKSIEAVYAFERNPVLAGGMGAARSYERWRETGDPSLLDAIAIYNDDDCRSTRELYEWLLARRPEAEAAFGIELSSLQPEPPRPLTDAQREKAERLARLRDALCAGLPEDEAGWSEDDRTRRRAADLLDYHSREKKPAWWAFFARRDAAPEQLCADAEAIGCLEPATDVPPRPHGKSIDHPLRFPEQLHKLGPGSYEDQHGVGVKVVEIDEDERVVWVRRGASSEAELPKAIITGGPYDTSSQERALLELGERVRASGLGRCGELDASVELLAGRPPRFLPGTPPLASGPIDLGVLRAQVAALDASVLFIQGPPGTGKTYTGGRLAVELMRRGRRIGVAANSHKAICKLLEEIEAAAVEERFDFVGLQKASEADGVRSRRVSLAGNDECESPDEDVRLIAGTSWLWSRAGMREAGIDTLFIDEAGQVSLADALAMAQAARNVVLLGDPQQLAHVSQGTHPRDSGRSVLEHLLGEDDTLRSEHGVFLGTTWRMHPAVCDFVSQTMYDGRLRVVDGLEQQTVESGGLSGAGLRMLGVEHDGNRIFSGEEAERVRFEIERLLEGGPWRDRHGMWRPLTLQDILVVAPYNAQVRCLERALPPGARVGTVDKFQGQEAPVVFFSMASSSGEDVPRGKDFLFSRNRLNVALSRAQVMAVVVCSPKLLWTRCGTVEQMRLVNMLCGVAAAPSRG